MAYRILLRRDNSANWTYNDPVLLSGEPGFETDTYKLKIGDGQTPWTALPYFPKPALELSQTVAGSSSATGLEIYQYTSSSNEYTMNEYRVIVCGATGAAAMGSYRLYVNSIGNSTDCALVGSPDLEILIESGVPAGGAAMSFSTSGEFLTMSYTNSNVTSVNLKIELINSIKQATTATFS